MYLNYKDVYAMTSESEFKGLTFPIRQSDKQHAFGSALFSLGLKNYL